MGGFDNASKYALLGVGGILLAPVVLPIAVQVLRPLIKGFVKAGMLGVAQGRVYFEQAKESLEDLSAEIKDEVQKAQHELKAEAPQITPEGQPQPT